MIFTSNKFGFSNFELFIVDAEGKREPIRVTFTDGFDGLPVFAPDGRKLSWASGRRRTAPRKSSSPIGTMKRLKTNLLEPRYGTRSAANPMKQNRPAFSAFLILLTSLAPLVAGNLPARPLHLRPPTCAARSSFWLPKNWQVA